MASNSFSPTQIKILDTLDAYPFALNATELAKILGISYSNFVKLFSSKYAVPFTGNDIRKVSLYPAMEKELGNDLRVRGKMSGFKSSKHKALLLVKPGDEVKLAVRAYLEFPGYLAQCDPTRLENTKDIFGIRGKVLLLQFYKHGELQLRNLVELLNSGAGTISAALSKFRQSGQLIPLIGSPKSKLSPTEQKKWDLLFESFDLWEDLIQNGKRSEVAKWKPYGKERELYNQLLNLYD